MCTVFDIIFLALQQYSTIVQQRKLKGWACVYSCARQHEYVVGVQTVWLAAPCTMRIMYCAYLCRLSEKLCNVCISSDAAVALASPLECDPSDMKMHRNDGILSARPVYHVPAAEYRYCVDVLKSQEIASFDLGSRRCVGFKRRYQSCADWIVKLLGCSTL